MWVFFHVVSRRRRRRRRLSSCPRQKSLNLSLFVAPCPQMGNFVSVSCGEIRAGPNANVSLPCNASLELDKADEAPLQVNWLRNGSVVASLENATARTKDGFFWTTGRFLIGDFSVTVVGVGLSLQGLYECTVRRHSATLHASAVTLSVIGMLVPLFLFFFPPTGDSANRSPCSNGRFCGEEKCVGHQKGYAMISEAKLDEKTRRKKKNCSGCLPRGRPENASRGKLLSSKEKHQRSATFCKNTGNGSSTFEFKQLCRRRLN